MTTNPSLYAYNIGYGTAHLHKAGETCNLLAVIHMLQLYRVSLLLCQTAFKFLFVLPNKIYSRRSKQPTHWKAKKINHLLFKQIKQQTVLI